MVRGKADSRSRIVRSTVVVLTLLTITSGALPGFLATFTSPAIFSEFAAHAQDDQLGALNDEYAQLEAQGMKENFIRQLSFTILQEFLPPGTRMTSGYRSPEKQLDLIMRMAKARGIPTPDHPTVNDDSSWRSVLNALRAKGFIVASPTNTPHATEEDVFDMSGADISAIQDGCRAAEKAGKVKFKRILFEVQNNAVHVEIESIDPKALNVLGRRKSGSTGTSGVNSGSGSSLSEGDQRGKMIQQLQDMHDGEPDPLKKIDYDRSKKNLLDPATDADKIRAIDAEIKEHQKDAQQLSKESGKKEAIEEMSRALREDRYEDAEKAAQVLERKYPNTKEAQGMLAQIKTRRLILEAIQALDKDDCSDCYKARESIEKALELSPGNEGAKVIREDVNACVRRCRIIRLLIVLAVGIVLSISIAVGWFLFQRFRRPSGAPVAVAPTGLVLRGIEGSCAGQHFALTKQETVVGSKGPPNGVADIVVTDYDGKISRRHCSIGFNGLQYFVMDESTNGTTVNDLPVEKGVWIEIHNGDRISLAAKALFILGP